MKTETKELKPCPFCASTEVFAASTNPFAQWVKCVSCGAESGDSETSQEAADAWNTRSSDIEIERLTNGIKEVWKGIDATGRRMCEQGIRERDDGERVFGYAVMLKMILKEQP